MKYLTSLQKNIVICNSLGHEVPHNTSRYAVIDHDNNIIIDAKLGWYADSMI